MRITKRKIELTIEKSRTFSLRRRTVILTRCAVCGREAGMLPPEELAEKAGVSPRTVYRLIEAGQVHFTETADGHLLVCSVSFFQKE